MEVEYILQIEYSGMQDYKIFTKPSTNDLHFCDFRSLDPSPPALQPQVWDFCLLPLDPDLSENVAECLHATLGSEAHELVVMT